MSTTKIRTIALVGDVDVVHVDVTVDIADAVVVVNVVDIVDDDDVVDVAVAVIVVVDPLVKNFGPMLGFKFCPE